MRKTLAVSAVFIVLLLLAALPFFSVSAQAACPGAPPPRLKAGDVGRPAQVFNTLWQSPYSSFALTVMYRVNNDQYNITSGPQCIHGPYNWYQVNFKGLNGWITEGTGNVYWAEQVTTGATPVPPTAVPPTAVPATPAPGQGCPGAPPARLAAGNTARPAQVFSTLWQSPFSPYFITVMYRSLGDTFTINSGPQCLQGPYNWYQVTFKGISGWVTEGTGSTYWVEKVS
jgi:hypothetical protein